MFLDVLDYTNLNMYVESELFSLYRLIGDITITMSSIVDVIAMMLLINDVISR